MNKEKLLKEIENLGITLSKNQIEQIDSFCNYLIEYNKHTNLTAIKELESIYLKHIFDSLTLIKCVDFQNEVCTMLDIGTGAGFPGIIIKIVFPDINMTLLDSNNKKTKFLIQAVNYLNLENIQIINERAEEFINTKREHYDLVTARAVASSETLLELGLPYVKTGGYLVLMKGNLDIDDDNLNSISKILGGEVCAVQELYLPIESSRRTLIKIQKKYKTSTTYPRRYDQIVKNPLKKLNK